MNFGPQHSLTDPAMLAEKVPELLGEPPQLILELLIVCDEPAQATPPFCQQIGSWQRPPLVAHAPILTAGPGRVNPCRTARCQQPNVRDPPFGAVIVIWPELRSAMQSGVLCARAGRRGLARDPFISSARVAPTARAGPAGRGRG